MPKTAFGDIISCPQFPAPMRARLTIVCLVTLCTSLCLAQQSNAPAQTPQDTPTIRTTTRLVTVDVVVTENGHTVQGLSKDAFRILENGKEQETRNFDEHAYAAGPSAPVAQKGAAALPAHVYSNAVAAVGPPNVLLLDALNTPVKDQQYLRQQMVAYLKEIPAGTRIAIFSLGTRLRMVQGFTSDIAVLLAALDARKAGVNNSVLLQQQSDLETPLDTSDDLTALDVLDQFQGEIIAVQYDLRIQTTLDAMKQLGAFLGALPGRKNIIWLSGSFPLSLQPDESASNPFISQRNYSKQLQQVSDAFTANRIAVYPVDVRGTLPPAMFDAAGSSLNSTAAPRRRAGRGAQPLATAATQDFNQTDAEHSSMRQLAEETGGSAFYETNGLKQAIARAMEDGANYYTLTYTPQNKDFNGKFRRIEVKLTSGRYHLSYRRGYYAQPSVAPKIGDPDPLISPNHPAIQRGAPPAVEILFKARVLPADDPVLKGFQPKPGSAGLVAVKAPVTRYCLDYAVHMRDVNAEIGPDHLYHSALELVAIAYDPDGKPLNLVDHPFQFTLKPEEYEKLLHDGLNLREEIDVPQGEIYLRLAVHDLFTDQLGSLEVPIGTERRQRK
jgi:VWFA-related protein